MILTKYVGAVSLNAIQVVTVTGDEGIPDKSSGLFFLTMAGPN